MTSSILPDRPGCFSGVDTQFTRRSITCWYREGMMVKRVSFYTILRTNVNCMTPWRCCCKSDLRCTDLTRKWYQFLAVFWGIQRFARESESPTSTRNEKICLAMCLDQMARFAITSAVHARLRFPLWRRAEGFPVKFVQQFTHDILISLCTNALFVGACC